MLADCDEPGDHDPFDIRVEIGEFLSNLKHGILPLKSFAWTYVTQDYFIHATHAGHEGRANCMV